MEISSIESGDDQLAIYKVKDKEGNPGFIFTASHLVASFDIQTPGSSGGFGVGDGKALFLGDSYEAAMESLEELIGLFDMPDGTQKEYACWDEDSVVVVLHKGILGRHLRVGEAAVSRGELKSLHSGLKFYKKLHSDL